MKKFEIDFMELQLFAVSCIPPVPIARAMFWDKLINEYYLQMSNSQRLEIFNRISPKLDLNAPNAQWFYARYNPENQYMVKCRPKHGIVQYVECFKKDDDYWIAKDKFINKEFIISEERLAMGYLVEG